MDKLTFTKETKLVPVTKPATLTSNAADREEKRVQKLMNDIRAKETELAVLKRTAGAAADNSVREVFANAKPSTPITAAPAALVGSIPMDSAPVSASQQKAPKTLAPLRTVPKQLDQIDPTSDKILRLRGGSPPPSGRRASTPTRNLANVNEISQEVVEKTRKHYRRDLVGSGAAQTFDTNHTRHDPLPLTTQRRGKQQVDPNAAGSAADKPMSKKVFRSDSPAGGVVTMRQSGLARGKAMRSPSPSTGVVSEIGISEAKQVRNRRAGHCAPPSSVALGNPEMITRRDTPNGKNMPGGLRRAVFNPILGC